MKFSSAEEACEKIEYYLTHVNEREEIANKGRERAQALIAARSFWMIIDSALGKYSLQ